MPRLDGLQVIDALRQRSPGTRIVVLSGLSASRMESEVIERGASRYLEQGASLVDIRAAIHQAAGGGE